MYNVHGACVVLADICKPHAFTAIAVITLIAKIFPNFPMGGVGMCILPLFVVVLYSWAVEIYNSNGQYKL